ncbi:MAG: hypothetical protein JNM09_27660 [Blastocatellia bacterium]|nr:hypothetical protein [Blastocatellia bacterium]
MSQLATLFWLRYTVFKNSLTTRGEVARKILNALLLLFPLLLSVGIGIALFVALLTVEQFRGPVVSGGMTTVLATLLFLMLISQSTGASSHFDPRRFVLFPIKMSKLYLLNLLSALGEFSMLMILPSMAGMLLGLGFAYQQPLGGLLAFVLALLWVDALFICTGMLFAWLLSGRKRSREILFALLIGFMTIGGQLLPRFFITPYGQSLVHWLLPYRHIISTIFDWTPIGVWSFFFQHLATGETVAAYLQLLLVCGIWLILALGLGYALFWRLATSASASSSTTPKQSDTANPKSSNFMALRLPFVSGQISAIVAKELRYFGRNPATYLTILSALIFPLIFFRSGRTGSGIGEGLGWMSGWVGYVFLMNLQYFAGLFAYDAAGFRQYMLAPIKWSRLLLGKNIAIWFTVTVQIGLVLLGAELLDRNLTTEKVYVAGCSLLISAAIYSVVGNYVSIYFPYRVQFGVPAKRRENWSGIYLLAQFALLVGVIGLLLLPVGVGYWFKSKGLLYVIFALLAIASWGTYVWLLERQGKLLEERRFEIAETLNRKTEKV